MKEYLFTIQWEDFTACAVLVGEWTLYEFAEFIILKAVEFDFDHAFEFCDNFKNPYQSKERYTLFADMEDGGEEDAGVKGTLVSQVFTPGKRMAFLFDYGDDWRFAVTCTAVRESTGKRRSRKVVMVLGERPEQYPDVEDQASPAQQ
jgi:hypothetical protein